MKGREASSYKGRGTNHHIVMNLLRTDCSGGDAGVGARMHIPAWQSEAGSRV
jgi:hypothetical protein